MFNIKPVDEKDRDNKEFICPICKDFLQPKITMQLSCCHLFCKDCLDNIAQNNIYCSMECPFCGENSKATYIKESNRFAYNILSEIKIYCPHDECKDIIKLQDLDKHIAKCDFKKLDCPYCDDKNIYRKDLKTHLKDNMDDHFLKLIETVEELKNKK